MSSSSSAAALRPMPSAQDGPLGAGDLAQYERTGKIATSDLRPGDLVFFGDDVTDYRSIHHVGLYIGGGQMIEAPYTGAQVRVATIWRSGFIGATRP